MKALLLFIAVVRSLLLPPRRIIPPLLLCFTTNMHGGGYLFILVACAFVSILVHRATSVIRDEVTTKSSRLSEERVSLESILIFNYR